MAFWTERGQVIFWVGQFHYADRQSVAPDPSYGCRMGTRRCPREPPNTRGSKTPRKQMPEEGLEPTRPCGQRILSPPRLPFRHSGS
jgi:hypothetical protein